MRKIVMVLMLTTVLLFCAVSVAAEMAKEGTESGKGYFKTCMKGGIDHENSTFKRPSLSPKQ